MLKESPGQEPDSSDIPVPKAVVSSGVEGHSCPLGGYIRAFLALLERGTRFSQLVCALCLSGALWCSWHFQIIQEMWLCCRFFPPDASGCRRHV